MTTPPTVPLPQQIAAVRREIALRRNVYAKRVSNQQMRQAEADHELAAMQAVHDTLMAVKRLRATMAEHRYRSTGACSCGWTAEHMTDGLVAWLDHVFDRSKAAAEAEAT